MVGRVYVSSVTILLVLLASAGGRAGSGLSIRRPADEIHPKVSIWPTGVAAPLGYFVLARLGRSYCALRFVETGRSQEDDPRQRYALYEWYYQSDGSGDFMARNARRGSGKASWRFVPFIGRFSFQTGNTEVKCGDLYLAWSGGTGVGFSDPRRDDTEAQTIARGLQLAPTKWTNISDVRALDVRLQWYGYDSTRHDREVPVQSL